MSVVCNTHTQTHTNIHTNTLYRELCLTFGEAAVVLVLVVLLVLVQFFSGAFFSVSLNFLFDFLLPPPSQCLIILFVCLLACLLVVLDTFFSIL